MLSPENRVILITGANRGIGLATARTLSAAGYTLSLGARQPDTIPMDGLGDAHVHAWEATDQASSQTWVAAVMARFGRLDGVVLNAGVEIGGSLETGTEEEFDTMFAVNFKGPLWLARAALPHLRACGHGRVINVVSLAGKRVMRNQILGYSASKHAAMALTHAIRESGWADGVRATSICPGMVDTRMVEHVTVPEGQFKIEPEAIAETVAYALSLPNSAAVAEVMVNSRYEAMF
ncbi:MAG: SDR family NAD(P)-dependent oxidoreductase [Pseudomonadota bacterium]